MHQETSFNNPGQRESEKNTALAEYDSRIAAAQLELERAQKALRDEPYPDNPKERTAVYGRRLSAVDKAKGVIQRLSTERLETEERFDYEME